MPEDRDILVRLVFEKAKPQVIDGWVHWLLESGVEVVKSNNRAIEFKGAAGDVAKALDADLYLNRNDLPSIGTVGKVIGDGAVPPLAYVPQEPKFF
ncbi:hypothetical protein [Sphingopyxis sp. PET50]|uniref:hypothetical protein n=1 Tax=Sphingopyxis sp. PET50 TaxID=2976533 RepID=UPI0021AE7E75|nr:hypothetical protein [Sphingopyxis sp. PET50]